MRLIRLGIGNFRSIGEACAIVDLTKRASILVGANNAGKSNVLAGLRFLKEKRGDLTHLSETDCHLRDRRNPPLVVVEFEMSEADGIPSERPPQPLRLVREYSGGDGAWRGDPFAGIPFANFHLWVRKVLARQFDSVPTPEQRVSTSAHLSRVLYDSFFSAMPKVVSIPQHRQITSAESYELAGAGVIGLLAAWQHPPLGREDDLAKFLKVQELLRRLLHIGDLGLEVPHDKEHILVRVGSLRLPLGSYGAGVAQLIILAVAVLEHAEALVCIEEPEVHLHPTLQRELLRFLVAETSNRYLIASHSHALIEPSGTVDILHVAMSGQATVVEPVVAPEGTLRLLRDLGVRASDLLQANSVVWVEGPSDRVYLTRWLSLVAPDLVEGVHYSIMFYGGRLLSHVSLEREAATAIELVRVMRINQHSAIVVDSDRRRRSHGINATKQRIRAEAEQAGVYCWITDGREIENYLPRAAIEGYYRELGDQPQLSIAWESFDSLEERLKAAFGKAWRAKVSYENAKVEHARVIASKVTREHVSSNRPLRRRLETVVTMIRAASEAGE